eukprot:m.30722 g.30722  ORF g.30722 m.30722 type:complete len:542 (-) comp8232_c0_seq2:175-1800(-)
MEEGDSSDEEITYLGTARCTIAFQSTNEVELGLNIGDIIQVTRKDVGGGWWEGELNGVLGLFPEKYVTMIESHSPQPLKVETPAEAPASSGDGGDGEAPQANPFLGAPVQPADTAPATPPPAQKEAAPESTQSPPPAAQPVAVAIPPSPASSVSSVESPSKKASPGKKGDTVTYVPPPSISRFAAQPGTSPTIMSMCKWAPGPSPPRYLIKANEEKGKKFSGMKSFTTYDILTEKSGISVQRRYKHFDWLHAQFVRIYPYVTVPPLPEKQVAGRFGHDFIEHRTQGLQKFLERVAVHPILGNSSVFRHFVSAVDFKDWKTGKRLAEQQKPFLNAVTMYEGARTAGGTQQDLEKLIDESTMFVRWLQKRMNSWNHTGEGMGVRFQELSTSLRRMSEEVNAFDGVWGGDNKFKTWWSTEAECPVLELMGSLQQLGTAFEHVAIMTEQHNQVQMGTLVSALNEYSALIKEIPVVADQMKWKDKPEYAQNAMLICNVVLSEFRHFHETLVGDMKLIVETFVQQQVAYHKQVAAMWEGLLPAFKTS